MTNYFKIRVKLSPQECDRNVLNDCLITWRVHLVAFYYFLQILFISAVINFSNLNLCNSPFYIHFEYIVNQFCSLVIIQIDVTRVCGLSFCIGTIQSSVMKARGIKVILLGNGYGDSSSNPGPNALRFTFVIMSHKKAWIHFMSAMGK